MEGNIEGNADYVERTEFRARLQETIDGACAEVHGALTVDAVALQRAVHEFAVSLKSGGVPVERTLALVYDCIDEARLTPLTRERLVRTREHFVRWVLDAYYGAE